MLLLCLKAENIDGKLLVSCLLFYIGTRMKLKLLFYLISKFSPKLENLKYHDSDVNDE